MIDIKKFKAINTSIEEVILNEQKVLKVTKKNKIMEFDENTYAKLLDLQFHNGEIEVKMLSHLKQDAPDFARGFIGIAFRINEDDSKFESFYIRPTNGRITDPIRKNRAVQYFSYPKYTFEYFRKLGITDFENCADIGLGEWITLKAVIKDETAKFYLNNSNEPVLVVKNLKHGHNAKGAIGLFVDIGTEAYFKELKIKKLD